MPFIITDPCIETKDTACVDVCPVDCIHPRKDEPEFAQVTMLYIHPEECIDCGACVPACPVAAIYESIDATPSHQQDLVEANAVYRNGDADTMAKAEAIVKAHVAAHADIMAIPAAERQAAAREVSEAISHRASETQGKGFCDGLLEDRDLERQRHPGASRRSPGMG